MKRIKNDIKLYISRNENNTDVGDIGYFNLHLEDQKIRKVEGVWLCPEDSFCYTTFRTVFPGFYLRPGTKPQEVEITIKIK